MAQAVLGAIGRHQGIVVMTGAAGLGKTTLCRAVIDQLDRRTMTSLVTDKFTSTEDLLKTLLADFGVISADEVARGVLLRASRAELAAALHEFLVSLAALKAFAVVILDDAHELSVEALGEIRAFAENIGDKPALQIVLVGQPSLDTTLGRAPLREWNRRVAMRCRLMPIAADEVGSYIAHRLAVAGTSPRVEFDHTSAARVYEVSGGVPSVINLRCDRTLKEGAKVSASMLDGELVKAAAEGLDCHCRHRDHHGRRGPRWSSCCWYSCLSVRRRRHSCSVPTSLRCPASGRTHPRSPRHLNPERPSLSTRCHRRAEAFAGIPLLQRDGFRNSCVPVAAFL